MAECTATPIVPHIAKEDLGISLAEKPVK
jgi:hypothetical protein